MGKEEEERGVGVVVVVVTRSKARLGCARKARACRYFVVCTV